MKNHVNRRSFIQSALLVGSGIAPSLAESLVSEPENSEAIEARPRQVKIATISQMDIQPYVPGERMISRMLEIMETAAAYKPDIISVPETFSTIGEGSRKPLDWRVQMTSSAIERFQKFATTHECYVICPGHIK